MPDIRSRGGCASDDVQLIREQEGLSKQGQNTNPILTAACVVSASRPFLLAERSNEKSIPAQTVSHPPCRKGLCLRCEL